MVRYLLLVNQMWRSGYLMKIDCESIFPSDAAANVSEDVWRSETAGREARACGPCARFLPACTARSTRRENAVQRKAAGVWPAAFPWWRFRSSRARRRDCIARNRSSLLSGDRLGGESRAFGMPRVFAWNPYPHPNPSPGGRGANSAIYPCNGSELVIYTQHKGAAPLDVFQRAVLGFCVRAIRRVAEVACLQQQGQAG